MCINFCHSQWAIVFVFVAAVAVVAAAAAGAAAAAVVVLPPWLPISVSVYIRYEHKYSSTMLARHRGYVRRDDVFCVKSIVWHAAHAIDRPSVCECVCALCLLDLFIYSLVVVVVVLF